VAKLSVKLGIIGGGVMAEAILSCLLSRSVYHASEVYVSEPVATRRDFLASTYRVQVTGDNTLVAAAETLLLAVKPQVLSQVMAQLPSLQSGLVLSILAGVTLKELNQVLPANRPENLAVVRAMPNTPAQVGAGVTALAYGPTVTDAQKTESWRIFEAVGGVVEVPETLMDAVTGLSGSGPAYIALVAEALADGGVAAGLSRNTAMQLAIETILGTAKLLQQTGIHPAVLKDRVASPGGTTITGVRQLEQAGIRSAMIEAVLAATQRSQQLGKT
jgi:pyrroline-5-carboxylate reductase